jgi:hypothetical protein
VNAQGAQAVAKAVKKFVDDAVAEVGGIVVEVRRGTSLSGTGFSGGHFVINGTQFGASGTVRLAGAQLHTTAWSTTRIEGDLPEGAKSGEISVYVDDQTIKKGQITI